MKVIKYFTSPQCQPCKQFGPVMRQLQQEGVDIQFIDATQNPNLVQRYNVRAVPTCVIERNGVIAGRWTGIKSKQEVLRIYEGAD